MIVQVSARTWAVLHHRLKLAAKPPQDSLAGIAEGFMTDLRNLGRCLNSLAK